MTDDHYRLRRAFGFTQEDLDANRRGRLTARQVSFLASRYRRSVALAGATVIVLSSIALGAIISECNTTGLVIVLCLAVIGFIIVMSIDPQAWQKDIRSNSVKCICGEVRLSIVTTGSGHHRSTSYRLRVQEHKFYINADQFTLLKNNEAYRVFYTPNTERILSFELVPG